MEEATCNITESIRYEDGEVVLERGNDVETYVVPEGVTIISDEAFLQFANIKKIFIPKSVTEIENCAFAEISLQEIVVDKENTHYKSSTEYFMIMLSQNSYRVHVGRNA